MAIMFARLFPTLAPSTQQPAPIQQSDAAAIEANNHRSRLVDSVYTRIGPKGEVIAVEGPIFAEATRLLTIVSDATWIIRRTDRPVSITACDITGNGYLDIFIANVLDEDGVYNAVCINRGDNTFGLDTDHPLARISNVNAALWGDFDNDGLTDVYFCRTGPNMLWRQVPGEATNAWEDVTESTGTPNGSFDSVGGLFFDADHDGDLDIFVVNFDGLNELFNNNRDGTFTPIAQQQGVAGDGRPSRQVIAVDLEGNRDLDIIVVNEQPPHEVYLNDRLWRYRLIEELDERGRPTRYANLVKADIVAMSVGDLTADGNAQLLSFHGDRHVYLWQLGLHADVLHAIALYGYTLGPENLPATAQIAMADVTGDASIEVLYGAEGAWLAAYVPARPGELLHLAQEPALAGWSHVTLDPSRGPAVVGMPADGRGPVIWRPGPGRHTFTAVSFTNDMVEQMRIHWPSGIMQDVNVQDVNVKLLVTEEGLAYPTDWPILRNPRRSRAHE